MEFAFKSVYPYVYKGLFSLALLLGGISEAKENATSLSADQSSGCSLQKAEKELDNKLDFLPEVVAVVGEQPISGKRVKIVMRPEIIARVRSGSNMPNTKQLRQNSYWVIRQLVDQELLFKECREAGYYPELAAVRKKTENLEDRLGKERLKEVLKRQQMSRTEFLEQTANTIALTRWMNEEVYPRIKIDPQEIRQYYEDHQHRIMKPEKVEVSHILLAADNSNGSGGLQQLKRQAVQLAEKINSEEESFSQLAQKHSQCSSASNGGRLPPFSRGEMVREFERTAFNTAEGQLSEPVVTEYGVHLLKVHKHHPERKLSYEEAKAEIKQRLVSHEAESIVQQTIKEQRRNTSTEILFKP